jgi:hypothetical protein
MLSEFQLLIMHENKTDLRSMRHAAGGLRRAGAAHADGAGQAAGRRGKPVCTFFPRDQGVLHRYGYQQHAQCDGRLKERHDATRAKGKIEDEMQSSCYASYGVLVAKTGSDGRVNSIEFNNAGKLPGDGKLKLVEFVRKLADEYRIPAMKPNDGHSGWSYVSPDGARLDVMVREVFGIPVTRLVMSRSGE